MKKSLIILLLITVSIKALNAENIGNQHIIIDSIYSNYLNEYRKIAIYLPPNYSDSKTYPVIFATDGQEFDNSYQQQFDSLINNKILPPLILIGIFSNEKEVNKASYTFRQCEYIEGWTKRKDCKKIFEQHFNFFTKELINYSEQKYAISKNRQDRYFYGFSNGAGFGVTLSVKNPELISKYILFSMAGGKFKQLKKGVVNYPYIDLLYGNKEPLPLTIQIQEFDDYLTKKGYAHNLTIYDGGHDRKKWRVLFFERLKKLMEE